MLASYSFGQVMWSMFVFFCWSAPLGLVVYWTANNFIQLGQQYLLKWTLPTSESRNSTPTRASRSDRSADGTAVGTEPSAEPAIVAVPDIAPPASRQSTDHKKRRRR